MVPALLPPGAGPFRVRRQTDIMIMAMTTNTMDTVRVLKVQDAVIPVIAQSHGLMGLHQERRGLHVVAMGPRWSPVDMHIVDAHHRRRDMMAVVATGTDHLHR